MVQILAGLHGLVASREELGFLELDAPGSSPLQRHVAHQRAYHDWITALAGAAFPIIDAAFEWLEAHWPEAEGSPVVVWGDARLANVLFRDCAPVAVLDWEAAALGPPELDLGWMLFFHEYFQRVAVRYGYPGLPEFMERDRVVKAYVDATGRAPRDLDWFLVYAELRQALTSIRVSSRAVHFGEREPPPNPEDLIIDRQHLERIITE